jgi:hypothetical protein
VTTPPSIAAQAPLGACRWKRGLALAALAVCGACGLPPAPPAPRVLTFADLAALATPMNAEATFANDDGVPGGLRVRDYLAFDGTNYQLVLRNTWTEGYRSAYVTAEVWLGFDEVWVQPVYVPITGFTNGKPDLLTDPSAPDPTKSWSPIFSVGPDSAFYSPFWQTFYFQVPVGTDPDAFTTARKVIDSGLPLIPGPGHTMSIVPGVNVAPPTGAAPDQMLGGPTGTKEGYLDGKDVDFLDFGKNNFSWNDDLVVEPTPLFMLVYRDVNGDLHRMNVPTVAGTGPLYSNRPPNVVNAVPHYGALWRLYTVEVPPTARIFAPDIPAFADARMDYPETLIGTTYGTDILAADPADIGHWLGRVTLNPDATPAGFHGCFSSYDNLPATGGTEPCMWLDSQQAVESAVPASRIQPTDILVTCPFVSYDDVPFAVDP